MSDQKSPHEKLSSLGVGISDTVNDVIEEARPVLSRMADRVSDSMHELASQGRDALSEAERQMENKARHIRVTTEHYIQQAPFTSLMLAAGAGAAAALAACWFMRSRNS